MFNFFKKEPITFSEQLLQQLYRYAYSLCHNDDLAFDLVQSSCEKVIKKKKVDTQLKPYMMRIIRNEYIDHYRRNKLELISDNEQLESAIASESDVIDSLENTMVDKQQVALIMEQLSSQESELLYLWAVEGFSIQEISDMQNIPKGTLLSRLNRLKQRINKQFSHLSKQVS